MRRAAAITVARVVALVRVVPADAETLDRSGFRHERALRGIHGGPALMEPEARSSPAPVPISEISASWTRRAARSPGVPRRPTSEAPRYDGLCQR